MPAVASRSALVPWATIRPLPMTTRSSAMTSISWRRCEESRTVPPSVGEPAQQVTHPADAGGVQPVRRLVEDEHVRVPEQGRRRCRGAGASPGSSRAPAGRPRWAVRLTRSSISWTRVRGRPIVRWARVRISRPVRPACCAEASSRTPTSRAGVGQVGEPAPVDRGGPRGGRGEADDDAHRRRLAGAVGAEEAGDPTGGRGERDVVDGGQPASVGLRE